MVEPCEAGQFSGRRDEVKPCPAAPQIIHLCLGGFAGDGCLELLILRSLERALRGEMGARAVCEGLGTPLLGGFKGTVKRKNRFWVAKRKPTIVWCFSVKKAKRQTQFLRGPLKKDIPESGPMVQKKRVSFTVRVGPLIDPLNLDF